MMRLPSRMVQVSLALLIAASTTTATFGAEALPLLDGPTVSASSAQVTSAREPSGLVVSIEPGADGYPGVSLVPPDKRWDLAQFGHVEANITNLGDKPITLTLRVDDTGPWQSNPWNGENIAIKPGETAKRKVIFGYSFGKKGHPLDSANVAKVMIFSGKANAPAKFRVDSLVAGGEKGEAPPVDPAKIRITPAKDGQLVGPDVKLDAATQIVAKNVQTKVLEGNGIQIDFKANTPEQYATIKPPVGRWDLRQTLRVAVRMKNTGSAAVTPRIRVNSERGSTDAAVGAPLAPGASGEVIASFVPATPWQGIPNSGDRTSWNGVKGTGTEFRSDIVTGVVVALADDTTDRQIVVESIHALPPEPAKLPDWIGKRPPVEGDWKQTLAEEFDGSEVDVSRWNYYGENYWDRKSHFAKANTNVRDGKLVLTFSKQTGRQNDDPNHARETPYATGFLDSYGKWVQRYGYFESRMKLPKASGLWPAFWVMPDRGLSDGPQWKRQDTNRGAMEFDVMEHLTRWGPYRYNIALHWDGYDKAHKQTGSEAIYFAPDADGYITTGLLWLPGEASFYCNGELVAQWKDPRISSVESCLMYTLPMGGWDNGPLDDAQLPDEFVVDYVRVWQRADLASPVDGPRAPEPGNELGKSRR